MLSKKYSAMSLLNRCHFIMEDEGVIVAEADEKSDTLHTVKYASEQERALAVYEPEAQCNVATGGNERAKREYKATGVADASSLKEFLDRCQRNDTRA